MMSCACGINQALPMWLGKVVPISILTCTQILPHQSDTDSCINMFMGIDPTWWPDS